MSVLIGAVWFSTMEISGHLRLNVKNQPQLVIQRFPVTADITQDWNVTWGGSLEDVVGGGAINETGEYIYSAGCTHSFGESNGDAFLVKYATNGTKIWNCTWGGAQLEDLRGCYVDNDNNIFATGRTLSFSVGGALDAVLLKYNSSGDLQWYRVWGKAYDDCFYSAVTDSAGNIYCAALYTIAAGNANVALVKYDPSGTELWNRSWGTVANDMPGNVAMEPGMDNVYLFGGSVADAFVLKYNSTGDLLWQRTWGGASNENWAFGAVDSQGFVYLAGQTLSYGVAGDVFLAKYNSTGTELWNRTWGGNQAESVGPVVIDASDKIYLAGETTSFGVGTDAVVIKYDGNGNKIWNITWGGTNWDSCSSLCLDENNTMYLVGSTNSYGQGGYDAFLAFVPDMPLINASTTSNINYGTSGNKIHWTICDWITNNPTFSVYHNESLYGTAGQSWTSEVPFTTNIDGLAIGDHNFTIVAQDGYGLSAQKIVVVSILPTNGIWQDISIGFQPLSCADKEAVYADFYLEGIATGGRIKITALAENPMPEVLQGGIIYYSIEVDGVNKISFPVTGKFYYDPAQLPEGVKTEELGVYHYVNGQWTLIGGLVNINSHYITAGCPSFSAYAIAPISEEAPFDPEMLTWIIAIAAAILVAYGCIKFRKGKGNKSPEVPVDLDLDFDP